MNSEINYSNNPLHGLSLKDMLAELIAHYGFEILYAYLNINCFNKNASLESSIKFLKKTAWAREKVELFYLYQYKNLPKAAYDQFQIPPRDRIIPDKDKPRAPAVLSIEDAERIKQEQAEKAKSRPVQRKPRRTETKPFKPAIKERPSKSNNSDASADPWAKWKE